MEADAPQGNRVPLAEEREAAGSPDESGAISVKGGPFIFGEGCLVGG